jgi:hypothetical protein
LHFVSIFKEVAYLDLELTCTLVTHMIHDQKPKAVKELDEAKMFSFKNQAVSYKECKK